METISLFKRQKPTFFKGVFVVSIILSLSFYSHATVKISTGSGNWNSGGLWSPTGTPGNGDVVIIASGHTVTVNSNTSNLSSLTVNGTLIIGNNSTNRTVRVTGDVIVNAGGTFKTAGNGGNSLRVGGNLVNSGSFDMRIGSATADVTFEGAGSQTISGTGTVTDFNGIVINNTGSTSDNIIEVMPSNFSAASGFLTLSKGVLKMSGTYTFSDNFFNTANPVISSDEGIWINNPNVTVTGQNGDTQLYGLLRISNGTYNIGVSADWWLAYYTGAQIIIDGGVLNVSGALMGATTSETVTYTQSGGVVTVNTAGNNYSVASFEIWVSGSVFNMSGGSIVMQRPATAFADYVNYSANSTITGGVIMGGNSLTPGSSIFWLYSTPALYDLDVSATNNPLVQLRTNTTVLNNIVINGILDAATMDIDLSVGKNWTNNGVFLPASNGVVAFNGNSNQVIGGLVSTTFNKVEVNNTSGGITLNKETFVNNDAAFTAGIVYATSSTPLTFLDNATATGANNNITNPSFVNGLVKKIGNDAFTFPVGKAGAGYHYCSISAPTLITDVFSAEYIRNSGTALGSITAPGLYTVSNCEYWNINRVLGVSSVNVTLSWNGYSSCNMAGYITDLSSLKVVHFNGSTWNSYGSNSNTGNASSGSVTWNNVTSFSPFTLGSNSAASNPLPVKFSSVKAYPYGVNNRIEWTNETEEGVERYEIEKSYNGNSFSILSHLNARSNLGSKEDYIADDINPGSQTFWYRIKAIDFDGSATYSRIVKVGRTTSDDAQMVIYPNPVTNSGTFGLQISSAEKTNFRIIVSNLSGQKIMNETWQHNGGLSSRTFELPGTIGKGMYFVHAVSETGITLSEKLLVQ
ncbi:MAG: T9SS type A sorting domain-containing protein [Chitinophagales bacterium]|nr:T9SS type A sorting domain-containing protein [Chitinophagales bacterium]